MSDNKKEPTEYELNHLKRYFKEIGDIYRKNDDNYDIKFSEENRDKLLQMNLKGVIKIAKQYVGMGVSLEDLIGAGNMGLCRAYEKYNPYRSKFAKNLIEKLEAMEEDEVPMSWIEENLKPACLYGNPLKKYQKMIEGKSSYNKSKLIKWINNNIKSASFNSIAMIWVTAFIRQEVFNNSLIKAPMIDETSSEFEQIFTDENDKPREGKKRRAPVNIIDIDQPVYENSDITLADTLELEDDTRSDIDEEDSYAMIDDILRKLLKGVKLRDRRILLKRYGVGYVRAMQPFEIAETENMSVARVSQIIKLTLSKMKENADFYQMDASILNDLF